MRDKIRLRGDSKHTGLKPPLERNKRYLWTSLAAIFIILAAVCLLSISPAMGQNIEASSSGVWTKVSGGSGVTGTGTEEVRWGTKIMGQKSGLRFDGQSVASSFGQEFCLGKLTHFNWPITSGSAANGATLQIQMKFTNPALGSVYFTYDMGIDETPNTGTCDECKYKPCDDPCPDKISWPSVPPANQSFELNGDTYTLQIVGIKDSCSGGNTLKHFITQEEKNNVGYLVGRIVLTSRPDAIDDEYETKTNVPLTVPAPGVLWNDFDRGGLPLTVTEYTQPANGQVVMNKNDGSFTYTPNQDFCGTDTFTYTITNGKPGKFDTATVKIVVVCDDGNKCTIDKCVNGVCTHTPVNCDDGNPCTDDSCDPATGNCVYINNIAPCDDGKFCTVGDVCKDGSCTSGTLRDCNDGIDCTIDSCNEDADECEHSADDSKCDDDDACTIDTCDPLTGCTYEDVDCDDGDPCTEDSCDPAIGCIHTPIIPEAVDDSYGAIYGKTLTVSAAEGVLVNDVYDGSGTMTATLVTGPSSGTLSLNADGSFTYKPKTGFVGTVTFTYKACDGNCCSDPATVTIIVAKCPWTLRNDLYSAKCGEDKVVPASQGILANDPTAIAVIDPGSITIDPVYGTIEVNEDGSFVYHAAEVIPSGTYVQFTYTATNGVCSASNSATAKIQIICPCR